MDPNENIKRQRELAAEIIKAIDSIGVEPDWDDEYAIRAYDEDRTTVLVELVEPTRALAEHVQALDEWLGRGGFLPSEWAEAPHGRDRRSA